MSELIDTATGTIVLAATAFVIRIKYVYFWDTLILQIQLFFK